MNDDRGSWYLLTGVVLGFALGLVFAWVIQPVKYVDTDPASFSALEKDRYRALVAAAYLANGDIVRARARLELLGDSDPFKVIAEQAQHTLAQGNAPEEARALGLLAIALGQSDPGIKPPATQNPATPTNTPTIIPTDTISPSPSPTNTATWTQTVPPSTTENFASPDLTTATLPLAAEVSVTVTDTFIPRPTGTPTRTPTTTITPGAPFVLSSQDVDCQQELETPLIIIQAMTRQGKALPGILVIVTWGNNQEERFFTGLKPEKGLGYADFTPTPGVVYTIRLGENGQPAFDLQAAECQDTSGGSYWGALILEFVQ